MSMTRSRYVTASRTVDRSFTSSMPVAVADGSVGRAPVVPSLHRTCWARLTEPRLHTAVSVSLVTSMISVHRFDDLMVPRFCWLDFPVTRIRTIDVYDWAELTVGCVLVQHERSTSLDLGLENSVPQLLRLDGLPGATFAFVLLVESLELFSPHLVQTRRLVGTEERPLATRFDTLHAAH